MMISDVPRDLIYKYVEDINYFIGSNNEKSLEREFYDRLIRLPFIANSPYATNLVCTIFNNARYIYYLIDVEENSVSLCFYCYLTKAAEGIEDEETQKVITASTMALVYNWISYQLDHNREYVPELKKDSFRHFCENKEADVSELKQKIFLHYSEESKTATTNTINSFFRLIKCNNLHSNVETIIEDIRDLEEAADDASVDDVAKGIDFLIECCGSVDNEYMFLNKILNRLANNNSQCNYSSTIDKLKRKLIKLESAQTHETFTNLPLITSPISESSQLDLEVNIEWITNANHASKIIKTLKEYMNGKMKPKDLLMPLCAALEARLIRKPTYKEYIQTFEDHPIKSPNSINNWVSSNGTNTYKRDDKCKKSYNELVNLFKKIG